MSGEHVPGMVFHPGHHALHGVTVVVETAGGVTYVARFDREDERGGGVHLLNVAIHDPATADRPLDEFLARMLKFGVRAERKHLLLAADQVLRIRPLGDLVT